MIETNIFLKVRHSVATFCMPSCVGNDAIRNPGAFFNKLQVNNYHIDCLV